MEIMMEMMIMLLLLMMVVMIENIYIYIYLSILINKFRFLSVYLCQRSLAHARSFADLSSLFGFIRFGCLSLFGSALHLPFLATSFHFKNRSFCLLLSFSSNSSGILLFSAAGQFPDALGFSTHFASTSNPEPANISTLMKQNRIYLLNHTLCMLFGVKCATVIFFADFYA